MNLHDLWVALCLVLVIEGLMPFASPKMWKRFVGEASALEDKMLRAGGLAMMLVGTLLLYGLNR
jgi:uncharacterized protein YjeT (DUF2065 family)